MEKLVYELMRNRIPGHAGDLYMSIYYNTETKGFRILATEEVDKDQYNIFEVHLTEEDRCGIVASLLVQREEFFD